MNKKIFKILVILLLTFVGFFIKIDEAFGTRKVTNDSTYMGNSFKWSAPIPFVTSSGKFINNTVSFKDSSNKGTVYAMNIEILESGLVPSFEAHGNFDGGQELFRFWQNNFSREKYGNMEYIKIYLNDQNKIELKESNETDYKNQYKNKDIVIPDNHWAYQSNWKFNSYTSHDEAGVVDKQFKTALKSQSSNGFIDFMKKFDGFIVKKNTNVLYNQNGFFKKTFYNEYKKYFNSGDSKYSINEMLQAWKAIQSIADIPDIDEQFIIIDDDVDDRGYGVDFYKFQMSIVNDKLDSDVKKVIENLKSNLKDNDSNNNIDCYQGTTYHQKLKTVDFMEKYLYFCGRYLFDAETDKFIEYYKYTYANYLSNRDKVYQIPLNILENNLDLEKVSSSSKKIEDDNCIIYCPDCLSTEYEKQNDVSAANDKKIKSVNSQACTNCLLYSDKYKKCKSYEKDCHDTCRNSGNSYDNCYNNCMDNKLGDFTQKLTDAQEKLKNIKNGIIEDTLKKATIYLANAPELDINFGEGAKIKCEDVSFLHPIYMIMIIIAPILVIILGSLDFFKAMLASDEQKMNKFKKAFPKRLIMLVLLFLVPMIISFLVSNVAGLKDTMMDYVINGCSK